MFFNDFITDMILASGVKIISCTWSCDRSLNLCRVVERSNISLAFFPSSYSSFFFLSCLETDASSSRDSLCRMHAGAVDKKSQLDKKFKMLVQRENALFDSTSLQSAMFLMDRLARLLDLPRDFFMLTHICHVRLWLSIDWSRYGIANSLNPFLYRPFVSALSITRNPYLHKSIFAANSRGTTRKIRYMTCRYSYDQCKCSYDQCISSWYCPVWTGSEGSRCCVSDV